MPDPSERAKKHKDAGLKANANRVSGTFALTLGNNADVSAQVQADAPESTGAAAGGPASGPQNLSYAPTIAIVGDGKTTETESIFTEWGFRTRIFSAHTRAYQVVANDVVVFFVRNLKEGERVAGALRVMRYGGCVVLASRSIRLGETRRALAVGAHIVVPHLAEVGDIASKVKEYFEARRVPRLDAEQPRPNLDLEWLGLLLSSGELRLMRFLLNRAGTLVRWTEIVAERGNPNQDAAQKGIERLRKKVRHLPISIEPKKGAGVIPILLWRD